MTASHDNLLRVWRLSDGACLRSLAGHTEPVLVVLDVGGGRAASGGRDCELRVWDVLSGKQLLQMPKGEGFIYCAAALWGDRIVTGHYETGKIRLWTLVGGGRAAGMLQGHTSSVWAMEVVGGTSTAQRLLASSSSDGCVRLWDVDARACMAVLMHHGVVKCLVDLGGGWLLSGSSDGSIRVWSTPAVATDTTRATGALPGCRTTDDAALVLDNALSYDMAAGALAHDGGDPEDLECVACPIPGGVATCSVGSSRLQRWKWDEHALSLSPDGPEFGLSHPRHWEVWSLAAVLPGPLAGRGRSLRLLAGTSDGQVWLLADGGTAAGLRELDPPRSLLHPLHEAGGADVGPPRRAGVPCVAVMRP